MKTIGNFLVLIFWSLALMVLHFSCTPESCMEETQAYVKLTFREDGTGILKPPEILTVYGIGKEDKLIYDKAVRASSVMLPLDPNTESCGFVFIMDNVKDTVFLNYSSFPHFINKECGYTYFHNLNNQPQFTQNIIKDLSILNRSVLIPNEENIKIFY
jgi:hypothetical protein